MSQRTSGIVIGILFTSLATASFAGGNTDTQWSQKDLVDNSKAAHSDAGPNGFGQHMADSAQNGGNGSFSNFGDFLRFYTGKTTGKQN